MKFDHGRIASVSLISIRRKLPEIIRRNLATMERSTNDKARKSWWRKVAALKDLGI